MDNIREIPWTAAMDRQQRWLNIAGERIPAGHCIQPNCVNEAAHRGLTCGDHECMIWLARILTQETRAYLTEMRATMPELDEEEKPQRPIYPLWLLYGLLMVNCVLLAYVLVTR